MRAGTRPRTQEVTRTSTAALKLELGPTRWRRTTRVHLEADGYAAEVEIVEVPCASTKGGARRFLRCARCGNARVTVIGLVPGIGWCCRACGRWRSVPARPPPPRADTELEPPA